MPREIWTIGHSNRSLDEFVELLQGESIGQLADVRRFPGSRAHPHFNLDALEAGLAQAKIGYRHFASLGGRRSKRPADSPNVGWRVDSFNRYADYMATPEFHAAIDALLASDKVTAYMCAEAVPWRCHRNLVSDELVRRGIEVMHILGPGQTRAHELNPFAVIEGDHLIYPPEQASFR